MTKQDVPPLPEQVPRKRRQLQNETLDVHIAMWLAGERELSPGDRKRLTIERARRKALVPDRPAGLLVGREGVTPEQMHAIRDALAAALPTEIHHPGVVSRLHTLCRSFGVPVHEHRDVRVPESGMREVVRLSQIVVAAPKELAEVTARSPVWDMIRYAKHRSVAVQIVLPDGRNIGSASGS